MAKRDKKCGKEPPVGNMDTEEKNTVVVEPDVEIEEVESEEEPIVAEVEEESKKETRAREEDSEEEE